MPRTRDIYDLIITDKESNGEINADNSDACSATPPTYDNYSGSSAPPTYDNNSGSSGSPACNNDGGSSGLPACDDYSGSSPAYYSDNSGSRVVPSSALNPSSISLRF